MMQILGCFNKNKNNFNFYPSSDDNSLTAKKNYMFSNRKVFIHIDGIVTKLSDKVITLTKNLKSLDEKIAYLYYLDFNIESNICGSFNIFLFDFSKKKLKIIRDTRGTRSLFYANNREDFIFSSDQNAIIKKIKKVSLNKGKLLEFLNWDYKSNNETYFNEIFRAQPGHYLTFSNNTLISKSYSLSNQVFQVNKNNDLKENFKKSLYRSVIGMADKNKRIGVMMSGGLDSSAIAIALKENNYKNVRTYSANFKHLKNSSVIDETIYQRNITEFTKFPHSFVQMKGRSPILPIINFTKILCQPILFPNIYIFEEIVSKLKKDNVEVILDGSDGDNTVSHGFEVIYHYFKKLRFIKFIKEIYLYSKFVGGSFRRLLYTFTKQAIKQILKIRQVESKSSILKNNLVLEKNHNNIITFFSSHKKKLSIDLHFQANENRNDFFRYFNIENFSPFYDEELINFCLNMPNEKKLNNGITRKVLRDFLIDFLPEDHAKRHKSILTPGLLENFTNSDLKISKAELKNINKNLLSILDIENFKNIIKKVEKENKITEEELINIQIFISANTFLNFYNL